VAKILVADDNSNIQKMVGLALKDQGIDVVAVGNGEAAVRKISDLRPDLVLADVFMPVRNGYEVCQYVKLDASLAHIPVILLVGAFDPLDEQEAQRVGADGVLKKPFVPPDPLISMVKSALQRAGVAHGGSSSGKGEEAQLIRGTDLLTPSSSTPPPPFPSIEPAIAPLDQESFVDEVPARPEPVRIDSGSHPVAFGSLLETPTEEKEDDIESIPPVNPEMVERDWRDSEAEEVEEEEEEEKPPTPWRREGAETYADSGTNKVSGAADWRKGGFEQIQSKRPTWEPEEEKPQLVESSPAASSLVTEAPPAQTIIPEPTPVASGVSATPFPSDAWAAAITPAAPQTSANETATALAEAAPAKEQAAPAPEVARISEQKPAAVTEKPKDSWFSVPANPWNAEMEKANKLASAWDAAVPVTAPPVSSNGTEKAIEPVSEETPKVLEEAAMPTAAVEATGEEAAAHFAEDATQAAEHQDAAGAQFYATEAEDLVEAQATTEVVPSTEDLVAKVLAKMSPDVLQAVTREILKPVVEAMVKDELKSKKP